MPNIVIRHLSGTKANQVEEIPMQGFREVLIGREATAHIRFDADREDLVSRNHARIIRDPADPAGFLLTDLDSRNGTFINRQRIYGPSRLQHGDRVQMGPSGPEFSFELDPPPAARPTRLADANLAPPTREAGIGVPLGGAMPGDTAVPPGMMNLRSGSEGPRPVGRATVERLVGEVATQMRGESRKTMWTAVIGVLVILILGAGYFLYNRQQQAEQLAVALQGQANVERDLADNSRSLNQAKSRQEQAIKAIKDLSASKSAEDQQKLADATAAKEKADAEVTKLIADNAKLKNDAESANATVAKLQPKSDSVIASAGPGGLLTPEQIHAANVKSVILVEATWKLTDTATGGQIYLYHHRNDAGACLGVPKTEYLPVFVEVDKDGKRKREPVLSTVANDGNNTPIVGAHSGTGFLVSGDGFFLTNAHVLAAWRAEWNPASFTKKTKAILLKNGDVVGCLDSPAQFPADWVPFEGSSLVVDKMESASDPATGLNVSTASQASSRLKYSPLGTSVQGEATFNVTFAKTAQRYRATSVALSEKHDIALGKVDVPGGGQKVPALFADSGAINPGQQVVVMGYPAVSLDVLDVEVSRDMFNSRSHVSPIADPTLTQGPISKVNPGSDGSLKGSDGLISEGEAYQLGINTTGAGNSGGPVFDDKGRVIAVFYAGRSLGGAAVTYAVPIKFGIELINNPSIIR